MIAGSKPITARVPLDAIRLEHAVRDEAGQPQMRVIIQSRGRDMLSFVVPNAPAAGASLTIQGIEGTYKVMLVSD